MICRVCAIPLRHMIGKPFPRHRTNPRADIGEQSGALPLFSRSHLATSRLPCGIQVHCALAFVALLTFAPSLPYILPASLGNRAI